jgi:tRNA A-37 threonylcarbamoyl transferase component Bud32
MHELDVVHNEIHGDNILVTDNDVFIIDYGLAQYIYNENGEFSIKPYQIDSDYNILNIIQTC